MGAKNKCETTLPSLFIVSVTVVNAPTYYDLALACVEKEYL